MIGLPRQEPALAKRDSRLDPAGSEKVFTHPPVARISQTTLLILLFCFFEKQSCFACCSTQRFLPKMQLRLDPYFVDLLFVILIRAIHYLDDRKG